MVPLLCCHGGDGGVQGHEEEAKCGHGEEIVLEVMGKIRYRCGHNISNLIFFHFFFSQFEVL